MKYSNYIFRIIPLVPRGQLPRTPEKPRLEDKHSPTQPGPAGLLRLLPQAHTPHPVLPQKQRGWPRLSTSSLCLCSCCYPRGPRQHLRLTGPHLHLSFSIYPPSPLPSPCLYISQPSQPKVLHPGSLLQFGQGSGVQVERFFQAVCQRGMLIREVLKGKREKATSARSLLCFHFISLRLFPALLAEPPKLLTTAR